MPAGGGPRAAREIIRRLPRHARDRALGVRGPPDRARDAPRRRGGLPREGHGGRGDRGLDREGVAGGGTSLSAEVIGGIVHELAPSCAARRSRSNSARPAATRSPVRPGEGLSMAFQPIVDLAAPGHRRHRGPRPVPLDPAPAPDEWFAEAVALELGVQLELTAIEQRDRGAPAAARRTCTCRSTARTRGGVARARVARRPVADAWSSRSPSTSPSTTTTALRRARAAAGARGPDRDRRRRRRVRQSPPHPAARARHHEGRHLAHPRHRPRPRPRALASALISFADEMGMTIVAEGIETEAELKTLATSGCAYGQGFYLAEPAPLPSTGRLGAGSAVDRPGRPGVAFVKAFISVATATTSAKCANPRAACWRHRSRSSAWRNRCGSPRRFRTSIHPRSRSSGS